MKECKNNKFRNRETEDANTILFKILTANNTKTYQISEIEKEKSTNMK